MTQGEATSADFEGSQLVITQGETIDFTDLSTANPYTWEWIFEGGLPDTSYEQNPAGVRFNDPGEYDVTLTATNCGSTDMEVKVDYILVNPGALPVADFEADATAPAIGQEVHFTDLSTGTVTTWSWTFQDGTPPTSMLETPEPITWAVVGLYDVTLTVANDYGEDTMVKEDYIDVQPIGISELDVDGLIKVYPNPSYGNLNIENATGEDLSLSIYTMTGQVVHESNIKAGTSTIGLGNLDAGLYFIRYIIDNQAVKTGKLIIK